MNTMQLASIPGFFRTLIIIFCILMLIRYATRVFLPYILKFLVKKSEDHINQKFQEYQNQQDYSNTQQTNNASTSKPKKDKKQVGEYIDFEEID